MTSWAPPALRVYDLLTAWLAPAARCPGKLGGLVPLLAAAPLSTSRAVLRHERARPFPASAHTAPFPCIPDLAALPDLLTLRRGSAFPHPPQVHSCGWRVGRARAGEAPFASLLAQPGAGAPRGSFDPPPRGAPSSGSGSAFASRRQPRGVEPRRRRLPRPLPARPAGERGASERALFGEVALQPVPPGAAPSTRGPGPGGSRRQLIAAAEPRTAAAMVRSLFLLLLLLGIAVLPNPPPPLPRPLLLSRAPGQLSPRLCWELPRSGSTRGRAQPLPPPLPKARLGQTHRLPPRGGKHPPSPPLPAQSAPDPGVAQGKPGS